MRLITLILASLLLAIQYPLWFGKGGWLRVHELERQIDTQERANAERKARNDKIAADVGDLRQGVGAVEERARYELGMVKEGEIFVQVVDPTRTTTPATSVPAAAAAVTRIAPVAVAGTPR